jgi:hypothetical protein
VLWEGLSSVACAAAVRPADSSCYVSAWDISSSLEICCTVRPVIGLSLDVPLDADLWHARMSRIGSDRRAYG